MNNRFIINFLGAITNDDTSSCKRIKIIDGVLTKTRDTACLKEEM